MNDESSNLIEGFRRAGQGYIDSLKGDLRAVCADLRRRAREEGRQVVVRAPQPPHSWQIGAERKVKKVV